MFKEGVRMVEVGVIIAMTKGVVVAMRKILRREVTRGNTIRRGHQGSNAI